MNEGKGNVVILRTDGVKMTIDNASWELDEAGSVIVTRNDSRFAINASEWRWVGYDVFIPEKSFNLRRSL